MIKNTNTLGSLETTLAAATARLYIAVSDGDLEYVREYREIISFCTKQIRSITEMIKVQEAAK